MCVCDIDGNGVVADVEVGVIAAVFLVVADGVE